MRRFVGTSGVVLAVLAVAGCGRLNRSATLNQSTPGLPVAIVLQHQLARENYPAAQVTCAKTLVVNAGVSYFCGLRRVGTFTRVRFTFTSDSGQVNLGSVRAL